YPVAGTAQVVGRAPALLRLAQPAPRGVVAPVVEMQARVDAHPRGGDVVAVVFFDAELPAQQAGAPGRIDQPARAMAARPVAVRGAHHVRRTDFDRAHRDALHEFDAAPFDFPAEEILEGAAFELPGRGREHAADAELGAAIQLRAAIAEEKPEAELAHLCGVQVFAQPERVGEVMRAYFDRGLADLVGRGGYRMTAPFQYTDRKTGTASVQLQCKGEPRETTADDQDIRGRRVQFIPPEDRPHPPVARKAAVHRAGVRDRKPVVGGRATRGSCASGARNAPRAGW